MTRRTLQILVVVLSLALLAACFRIYHLSSDAHSGSKSTIATQKNTANRTNEGVTSEVSAKSNNGSGKRATESSNAKADADYAGGIGTIDYAALPKEAQTVIGMIQKRASFPYRQDGQTFSNRERILPGQPRGYYQEYTVPTPGADNRGARRIISGQGTTGDNANSGEYYYTSDHYRSFARVRME
ncbi:MAG: ribonuclease domain-containing protein [Burkholderiaceae bacterium]